MIAFSGRLSFRVALAVAAFFAILTGVERVVSGATLTWNGGGDGFTWIDADNWVDDQGNMASSPPGISDDAVIPSMNVVEVNGPSAAKTLQVTEALLKVNSDLLLGDTASIDRLRLDGRITNAATVMIEGASEWKNGELLGAGDVENRGTLTVDGGITRLIQGKRFRNLAMMTIDTRIDLESATFENVGTLDLNDSLSQRGLTPSEITNTGTITVGGVLPGTIDVPLRNLGGTLSTADLAGGLEIDRRAELVGGQLIAGDLTTIFFEGPDDHLFSGQVATSGEGTVQLLTDVTITGTLTNNLSGDFGLWVRTDLSGSGDLVNDRVMRWDGGSLELTGGIVNNFATVLAGSTKSLATTFRNKLNTAHESGSLTIAAGSEWINEVDSQYTLQQSAGPGIAINGEGTYVNRGTLIKNLANVVNVSSPSSHESGTIDVNGGELRFNGPSTHSGTGGYTVASAAKLIFNDQQHTFQGQHTILGAGLLINQSPATIVINGGSSLTVAINAPLGEDSWLIQGDITDSGELINDSSRATWVNGTIDVGASGSFLNRGVLLLDVGSGRTLAGSGKLFNQGRVVQARGLNLSDSGGGIENEASGTWDQSSNLTFISGSSGKMVHNAGHWFFAGDATIFDPGGILAGNSFRNTGDVTVRVDSDVTIHSPLVSEDGTLTIDGFTPLLPPNPPPARLTLDGGGDFVRSPITLGDRARLNLFGAGSGRSYVFQGPGAAITETGTGAPPRVLIGSGARIVAIDELTLNVAKNTQTSDTGTILDGGTLAVGDITNSGLFSWVSGEIAADFVNTGDMVIETSGQHLLTGSLTNAASADKFVVQKANLRIDGSAGVRQVVVANRGDWIMEPGAAITSQQTAAQALFRNEATGRIVVPPREAGNMAIIDSPLETTGDIIVGDNSVSARSATLSLTNKTGVIDGFGTLQEGVWIAAPTGSILFPEPIRVIGANATVSGTTANIPALSGLELNAGDWRVWDANIFHEIENTGKLLFGHDFVDPNSQVAPPSMHIDGDVNNRPGAEIDSAVDDSDGVVAPSLIASSTSPGESAGADMGSAGSAFSEAAIDLGTHRLVNEGIVRPGGPDDPGAFPLIGTFVQQSTGILEVDLGGTVPIVQHDQSIIYGPAVLGGTLDVRLLVDDGMEYEPNLGDFYQILAATEMVSGRFEQVLLPDLPMRLNWRLQYGPTDVHLVVGLAGDMDDDGDTDFDDIGPFVQGVSDPTGYEAVYGVPPEVRGDTDNDGDLDFDDIPGFVAILSGVPPAASARGVPEPACGALLVLGIAGIVLPRRSASAAKRVSQNPARL